MLSAGYSLSTPKPLLDTYPGAAAAYSLRKLRSGYTGPCVRVRRSSDNAETDIGFSGSPPTLDTTALLNFVGSGDGFVTTYYGQSSNLRDATQDTESNQPEIVSNGSVITTNGKPALDWLNSAIMEVSLSIASQPISIFAVVKHRSDQGFITDNPNRLLLGIDTNNNGHGLFAGSWIRDGGPNDTIGSQTLYGAVADGVNSEYYENDSVIASGDAGTNTITSPVKIGTGQSNPAAQSVDGTLQELIFYPDDQSANRSGIQGDQNNFYGTY